MVVGSPLWWLTRLYGELMARQPGLSTMDDWYTGNHPLPFLTRAHEAKMRNEFRKLLEDSRSNFMRLVVDATEERLRVEGFRLSASEDAAADEASWRIWQANQMDAESQTAFVESLVKGVSYLSVWAGDPFPTIAVEDPSQTIVGYVPGSNYRRRAAALKVWLDDWTGDTRANVYLPGGIHKFRQKASDETSSSTWWRSGRGFSRDSGWQELEDEFVANPLGVVPIVPLRNRPRLLVEGESELADVWRIQSQINATLFLLALASYMSAHKQRYAIGLTLHEDENTGSPVEPFDIAVDKLLVTENPDVKFGEFAQSDLSGYISAIEQKVRHIATTSRTPRHYLEQQGQSPSGDAIKSAESGLIKKVERKQRPFGEGLEEALRLARLFAGESDAPVDSEIVWADPQTRTEAETTDAAIKKFQAGLVSREQALEDLGYSPQQIGRMSAVEPADEPVVGEGAL